MKKVKIRHSETHARSIVKSITYRVVIVISVFLVTFFETGRFYDAAAITGITAVTGTIIYYFHERIWSAIKWGRK